MKLRSLAFARSIAAAAAIAAAIATVAAGCATPAERRAGENGAAAARSEVAEGRACIWEIGRLAPNAAPDPETGLQRISFTCDVSPASFAAQEAHNDEIRRAWREGRVGGRRR